MLTVGLSFGADRFTDKLVQATGTIWGVLGGPLAGIFILGFLLPCANSWVSPLSIFGGVGLTSGLTSGQFHEPPSNKNLRLQLLHLKFYDYRAPPAHL